MSGNDHEPDAAGDPAPGGAQAGSDPKAGTDQQAGKDPQAGKGQGNQDDLTNTLSNARNLLGFLLAGFGAVLSFIGLRSAELTTVLRNDSAQASFIALFLLLGVLAAVLAVASDKNTNVPMTVAAAIIVALLGAGSLLVFSVPTETVYKAPALATYTTGPEVAWLVIGLALVIGGAATVAVGYRRGRKRKPGAGSGLEAGAGAQATAGDRGNGGGVHIITLLILASVLLTGIAAYGGMRLEARSQLSFSSQVEAHIMLGGPTATAAVNVTAFKIPQNDWVSVIVYGLRRKVNRLKACGHVKIAPHSSSCSADPCYYLDLDAYARLHAKCTELLNGTIVPNSAGDVNAAVDVPFQAARFQDLDVRTYVCTQKVCEGTPNGATSRIDYLIPGPAAKKSRH